MPIGVVQVASYVLLHANLRIYTFVFLFLELWSREPKLDGLLYCRADLRRLIWSLDIYSRKNF